MKYLFCAVFLLALGAGAGAPLLSLPALHVKLAAPRGWNLNSGQAAQGWVSFYSSSAKEPMDAAIDVFYYSKGESRGSAQSYLDKLPKAEKSSAKEETLGGKKVWVTSVDYVGVSGFHSMDAKPSPHRRMLVVIGRDDGVVVLRLQGLKSLAAKNEAVLRKLAASVEPL